MPGTRRRAYFLLPLIFAIYAPLALPSTPADHTVFERLFEGPKVVNIVDDFLTFWELSKAEPLERQRFWWKRLVESKYPDYFERAVYRNADAQTRRVMLDDFLLRIPERIDELRQFNIRMSDPRTSGLIHAFAAFKTRFADYHQQHNIFIGLSLFGFDGAVRPVSNEAGIPDTLCLGAEVLCTYSPEELQIALLHEFFHLYHFAFLFQQPSVAEFRLPYMPLMIEGMAVAASESIEPGYSRAAYLHFNSDGLKAQEGDIKTNAALFLDLVERNAPPEEYEPWFRSSSTENVPSRGGYLLGLEVTRRVLGAMSLEQMARLTPAQLREHAEEQLSDMAGRQILVFATPGDHPITNAASER
jgi:hypothetical protein